MNSENPYESPRRSVDAAPPSVLLWTAGCVFGTGLLGSALGSPPFAGADFVVLIINNDDAISPDDQYALSLALVRAGCRYAVCIGHNCSTWDDSVDYANIEVDPELSKERFVMTSWHENDTPDQIARFFLNCTTFGGNVFTNYLVLSVGRDDSLLSEITRQCTAV